MKRLAFSRAVGVRFASGSAILIIALLMAWPEAQQGAESPGTPGRTKWWTVTRQETPSGTWSWLQKLLQPRPGVAMLEIRLDNLLQGPATDGGPAVDREMLTLLAQDIIGKADPVEDLRVGNLLDQVSRVRLVYRDRSVVIGRWTLTRIAQRAVGDDAPVDGVRFGDVLEGLPRLHQNPEALQKGLDEGTLTTALQGSLGTAEPPHPALESQVSELRDLPVHYAEVVALVNRVRRERAEPGGDLDADYKEAFGRLLDGHRDDLVPLLDGHQRLEKELAEADLASMPLAERIAFRREARRWAFGDDLASKLFENQEARERYEIDRLAVAADTGLSEEEKAAAIRDLRGALKVELAARGSYIGFPDEARARMETHLRKRLGEAFDQKSETERKEMVRQAFLERLPARARAHAESLLRRLPSSPPSDEPVSPEGSQP